MDTQPCRVLRLRSCGTVDWILLPCELPLLVALLLPLVDLNHVIRWTCYSLAVDSHLHLFVALLCYSHCDLRYVPTFLIRYYSWPDSRWLRWPHCPVIYTTLF